MRSKACAQPIVLNTKLMILHQLFTVFIKSLLLTICAHFFSTLSELRPSLPSRLSPIVGRFSTTGSHCQFLLQRQSLQSRVSHNIGRFIIDDNQYRCLLLVFKNSSQSPISRSSGRFVMVTVMSIDVPFKLMSRRD